MTHQLNNRTIAVLTVAALVLVSVATATPVAASDGPPAVPASFHGEVYVDGEPAPAGTEIVALIDGDERGAIVIDDSGQYGTATIGGEKLVVDGDDGDDGTEITFHVDGEPAAETATWEPGTNEERHLTVGEPPAELPGDGDENEGDGDDAAGGGLPSTPEDGDASDDGEDATAHGDETAGTAETDESDDETREGSDDNDDENADTGDESDESEHDGTDDDAADDDDADTDDSDDDAADDGMPGFGAVGALAGVVLIAALTGRRP